MARPLYEEPFVLAAAGTLAIHLLIAVAGDALVVTHPYVPEKDPPHVELVDVEVPEPPPPPLPKAAPPPVEHAPAPVVQKIARSVPHAPPPVQEPETPPPPATPPPAVSEPSGGGPVVAMDNLGPDATGKVPVAIGHPPPHIGRGGSGPAAGAGAGSGGADEAAPASVATIKTRALPKGDYGYIDASKDYPAEAKQLGIEGPVRVRLIVDARGAVTRATLLPPGLGHGLDDLALRKAREIQFAPAVDTDDHPVASVVVWTFNMTLPK